jgi:hypothetical protein
MTNVAAAVQAVEEEHEIRSRPRASGEQPGARKGAPRIAPGIEDAVVAALEAAHPKHFARLGRLSIISHVIVDSKTRHAPVPKAIEDGPPSPGAAAPAVRSDRDEVAEHYAARIAAMRQGQF